MEYKDIKAIASMAVDRAQQLFDEKAEDYDAKDEELFYKLMIEELDEYMQLNRMLRGK